MLQSLLYTGALQEKAQETEKYMSELTAEMEKVKLEKNKLEERNQLLEKVLSLSKQDAPPPTKGMLELVHPTYTLFIPYIYPIHTLHVPYIHCSGGCCCYCCCWVVAVVVTCLHHSK